MWWNTAPHLSNETGACLWVMNLSRLKDSGSKTQALWHLFSFMSFSSNLLRNDSDSVLNSRKRTVGAHDRRSTQVCKRVVVATISMIIRVPIQTRSLSDLVCVNKARAYLSVCLCLSVNRVESARGRFETSRTQQPYMRCCQLTSKTFR